MGKFHETELPGEQLILKGLEDLVNGTESIGSLLVSIGAPRLRQLNLAVPESSAREFPEDLLYRMLDQQDSNTAHARYNAFVRRLVSFETTLEWLQRRHQR